MSRDSTYDAVRISWATSHCRVWLGWTRGVRPPDPTAEWEGLCAPTIQNPPAEALCLPPDNDSCCAAGQEPGDLGAISFRVRMGGMGPMGAMGSDAHHMGLAWTCTDPVQPDLAARIQGQCQVFLGHSRRPDDDELAPGTRPLSQWGTCPFAPNPVAASPDPLCIGTAGDGQFHHLEVHDGIRRDDELGVAFICDEVGSALLDRVEEEVSVVLGIAKKRMDVSGRGERWIRNRTCWEHCPWRWEDRDEDSDESSGEGPPINWEQFLRDNNGNARHVVTRGEGKFHHLDVNWNFENESLWSIGIQTLEF